MSEESSSTPLRLKPKLRLEADGASAASAFAPESVPVEPSGSVAGESNQRLRLKPRLAGAESGEAAAVVPADPVTPASVQPAAADDAKVRLKPRLSVESEAQIPAVVMPDAPGEMPPSLLPAAEVPAAIVDQAPAEATIGGFKLKPKAASEEPPPLPAAEAIGKAMADHPGAVGPADAPPPPKFRIKPSPDVVKSFDETAKVVPGAAEAKRRSPALVLALFVVLLGGGGYYGYYGYRTFLSPGGSAAPESGAQTDAGSPSSLAGQMVSKAREAAAAQAGRFEGLDDTGVEAHAPLPAAPSSPGDGGVMAAMPVRIDAPPPEPSAAFTRYVTEMRISGVFQGDPPRALVNGRTIRAGEPIDIGLGIVFIGIDVDRRLILMREASGATAAKKY